MSSVAKIFEVVATPHGQHIPGWVRAGWVGAVLPCAGFTCGHIRTYTRPIGAPPPRKGLVPAAEFFAEVRAREDQQIDGFDVFQAIALQVLAVHDAKAAEWFYSRGYPGNDPQWDCFGFKMSEVKVLRYYSDAELTALKAA